MATRKSKTATVTTTTNKDLADKLRSANPKGSEPIKVPELKIQNTTIRVGGRSLITHRFSEKAKKQILDKKMGHAKAKREPCDPHAEFEAAKYKDEKGRDCVPSLAFKCAIVDAASFLDGITKVSIRGAVFVEGEYLPLEFEDCIMREDVVRVGMGSADLRFRPEYKNWHVDLPITFNPSIITAEQLHHLVKLAGFSVGVCEWRPQKDGQFGRFELMVKEGAGKGTATIKKAA